MRRLIHTPPRAEGTPSQADTFARCSVNSSPAGLGHRKETTGLPQVVVLGVCQGGAFRGRCGSCHAPEVKTVVVLPDPATKLHAFALKGQNITAEHSSLGDDGSKPGPDFCLARGPGTIEGTAETDTAVLFKAFYESLVQKLVMRLSVLGGDADPSEVGIIDAMTGSIEKIAERGFLSVLFNGNERTEVLEFRSFHSFLSEQRRYMLPSGFGGPKESLQMSGVLKRNGAAMHTAKISGRALSFQ